MTKFKSWTYSGTNKIGVQNHNIETIHRPKSQGHEHGEVQSCEHAGLQVTEKDLATEEAAPRSVGRIVSTSDGPTSLCGRTTTRRATSSEIACTRNEFSNKHSLGTAETSDAIPGE